ncbi:oxalate/formate antiporter family transporter [uncultured Roseburia sp.]|uniref:MFS transporter n=1 Tax=Brotonthovivens ammoniilytica TaxID=2981725 RepID=A0ABT2TPQ6_9FIRM|nr:MFS transporter [Brotonthovivens ammoniilytica]MCU6763766.1 MFS transporter [Brotonthovivens ammoniilytica]SCJ34253.1 oxalate/formate antiporter family transporter [uncultured Roseburia sp.]
MTVKKPEWLGKKQLVIILFGGVLFLICACVNAGTTNTILPMIAEIRGWKYEDLLPFMSYGGYIGAVATVFFGQLVVKKGPRFVIICGLLIGGASLALYGTTRIFGVFVFTIILNRVMSCAYQQAGNAALLNNWFPRTKGIVLGWATMGIILADIVWSPYIPAVIHRIGSEATMILFGCVLVLIALFARLFIKNTPEAAGTCPDNNPNGLEELIKNTHVMKRYQNSYTMKKLLRTKQMWQISIGWGLLWMAAVAYVSQIVLRCVSLGYSQEFGVHVLQIAGAAALAGSWFFGFLDLKLGTKKASQIYALGVLAMYAISLFHKQSTVLIWISACGMMGCVGGIANLQPSMVGTVFGRWDFAAANRLIAPVVMAVSSSSFLVVSIFLRSPWGRDGLYVFSIICTVVCFIIVTAVSEKMIGANDTEALQNVNEIFNKQITEESGGEK